MEENVELVEQAEPKKDVQGPTERVTLDVLLEKVAEAKRKGSVNSASGALGEELAIFKHGWTRRPVGKEMANLLAALKENGVDIKRTSFDALVIPENVELALGKPEGLKQRIQKVTFVEIKSARRKNMLADFTEFFFALTYREIEAAIALKDKHVVALVNLDEPERGVYITNVWALLDRARSSNWQLSIQLGASDLERGKEADDVDDDMTPDDQETAETVFLTVAKRLAGRRR